jgi:hypothetical protein
MVSKVKSLDENLKVPGNLVEEAQKKGWWQFWK